jgi:two-component system OmpR family response regulator
MESQVPHILIVDDDSEIRLLLSGFLQKNGFRISMAAEGRAMRRVLAEARIDLILLDLMLPGEDGLSLCREVRAQTDIPIIMITARGEETDRIVGLEIGADDYLPKPFSPRELLAHVRAVLRRTKGEHHHIKKTDDNAQDRLTFAGWALHIAERRLTDANGIEVALTAGEFDLLKVLAERPARVLNRDQLLDLTKGRAATIFDRSIDAQISRLRKKIEPDPANPVFIKTVRSGGYVFTAPESLPQESLPQESLPKESLPGTPSQ